MLSGFESQAFRQNGRMPPQWSRHLPGKQRIGNAGRGSIPPFSAKIYLTVAQLEERRNTTPEAAGLNPASGSSFMFAECSFHAARRQAGCPHATDIGRCALRLFCCFIWVYCQPGQTACLGSRRPQVQILPPRPVLKRCARG